MTYLTLLATIKELIEEDKLDQFAEVTKEGIELIINATKEN